MVDKKNTTVEPTVFIHQELLNKLVAMIKQITDKEGCTKTIIPFLSIYRHSRQTPLTPGVITPSYCLILQGSKRVLLGQDILDYHPGDYLTSVIDTPASGQITKATPEAPYIGLRIDFTRQEIASVATEAKINHIKTADNKLNTATFIGKTDDHLLELHVRLLNLLDKPGQASFLSGLIKREMIFTLLSGEYGHLFLQHALFSSQTEGVGKAIIWIKENLSQSFTAAELAKSCNISISGLHHKFKAITKMGPLQYQKNLRLQEARRLMLNEFMDAGTAALEVGYESPSQFSREYRRLFGLPPIKDIKRLRKNSMLKLTDID